MEFEPFSHSQPTDQSGIYSALLSTPQASILSLKRPGHVSLLLGTLSDRDRLHEIIISQNLSFLDIVRLGVETLGVRPLTVEEIGSTEIEPLEGDKPAQSNSSTATASP